ncbi:MAG TPA: hypothetical protein DCX75_00065 [Brevundimonas sp.]|uniref:DUF1499 domain-containing protein n=1 Tax=Brevundimonas sp. TaxID=1871086 RepID=UPI000C565E0C|nr:DUF1499 domain-containing protein [Brevundimonas sp.]MAL88024.1 hypothetical protein [Brevundimonas sp.]HAJ03588.1 hypothetical protein [Brevundimonas sp.]HAV48702.1 hypothetical protein [Brevundimonas sp.]|tara:strand:- start:9356 stop:10060 length:705 start_codon:yes stop_codon:yes gene_type:complete
MARRGPGGWVTLALVAGVLSAPLVVFIGVFGLRFGWWGLDVALDLLGVTVAPWLLGLGAICALLLLWRARRTGVMGWIVGLVALAMVGGGVWLYDRHAVGYSMTQPSPRSVSTNADDPPGFSARLTAARAASEAVPEQTLRSTSCPGVVSIPSQVRAEDATAALQRAGFTPLPSSLFQVEGTHEGLWFLRRHDVTIRIRPGQTDVRVAPRDQRPQGGETCRLLARIVAELQPRS